MMRGGGCGGLGGGIRGGVDIRGGGGGPGLDRGEVVNPQMSIRMCDVPQTDERRVFALIPCVHPLTFLLFRHLHSHIASQTAPSHPSHTSHPSRNSHNSHNSLIHSFIPSEARRRLLQNAFSTSAPQTAQLSFDRTIRAGVTHTLTTCLHLVTIDLPVSLFSSSIYHYLKQYYHSLPYLTVP
jgi:hypothetical protein